MFDPEKCTQCGDCFVDCHWIQAERDDAIQWIGEIIQGERSEVLDRCITCYACNERCPQQANPFDRIAELQDKYHCLAPAEEVAALEERFSFTRELDEVPQADRVMSMCVLPNTHAHLFQGELYDLPRVAGKPYFCWILFGHLGAESVQRRHAQTLVDRLAMTGAREIVCVHDDCYTMLARDVPEYGIDLPFRPVHFTEYLVGYLKENKDRVRPLDIEIAYNRPCASRLTPEKEHFVDEFFELAGVRRVKRVYDREDAMCCGGAKALLGKGDPRPDQEQNLRDAQNAGARAMVALCPVCIRSLAGAALEMKMPLVFIGDIARMALGEIEVPF